MSKEKQSSARAQFLAAGVLSASELATRLKVSQPTVSRLLKDFGPGLVRLGQGRSTRYALRREVEPRQSKWPLYQIDERGEAQELGWLHALQGPREGLWWLEGAEDWPTLKHGEFKDGLFEGLPWFLQDMRPQGYMGRELGEWLSINFNLQPNPTNWNNDTIFRVLLGHGIDLIGSFQVGDQGLQKYKAWKSKDISGLHEADKIEFYRRCTISALANKETGSSAAGERPKFTVEVGLKKDKRRHLIVKFSPPLATPTGQRWSDLLVAEHHAIAACAELTGQSTKTSILFDGGRCFLESVRFDRVSDWGRRAVVSLEAVDGAFLGMNGRPWTEAVAELRQMELIGDKDVETISLYWHLGELIGNNDMHYGNLSFFLHPEFPMTVCPPYDMLPMLYAPTRNGEIVAREFQPRRPLPRERELWQRAAEVALDYWEMLTDVAEISDAFKSIASENEQKVRTLL